MYGDGLTYPACLARPEKNFQNLRDILECLENIFVDSNINGQGKPCPYKYFIFFCRGRACPSRWACPSRKTF